MGNKLGITVGAKAWEGEGFDKGIEVESTDAEGNWFRKADAGEVGIGFGV